MVEYQLGMNILVRRVQHQVQDVLAWVRGNASNLQGINIVEEEPPVMAKTQFEMLQVKKAKQKDRATSGQEPSKFELE